MVTLKITINGLSKDVDFGDPEGSLITRMLSGEKATYTKAGFFVWKANPNELVGVRLFRKALEVIRKTFNLTPEQEFKYMNNFIG